MRGLMERARAIGARRAGELIDALVDAAEAELPSDLTIERRSDGIGIAGHRLARRLAFDGRLRGLGLILKARR